MEKWKKIKDWNYQVSDLGRVRSISRTLKIIYKKKGKRIKHESFFRGKIRKLVLHKKGYEQIMLFDRGTIKLALVHRLVLETFRPIKEKMQVNHINLKKHDNRLQNLEWCTSFENMRHAGANGRLHTEGHIKSRKRLTCDQFGEKNRMAKLDKNKVIEIFHSDIKPQWKLAKKYGVTQNTVSRIKLKRTWSTITKDL